MDSTKITELAIKRHDIDAAHFQSTYTKSNGRQPGKHEGAFLYGRRLVLDELAIILDSLPKGSKILDVVGQNYEVWRDQDLIRYSNEKT